MTEERFEELAAAWGGDVARWPEAERDAAALFLAASPDVARAILAREGALDAALDALPRFPAPGALFERIVESAATPAARRRQRWGGWLLPAGLSATLAAATAAGLILGAQLGAHTGGATEGATATAELDVSGLAGDV